MELLWAGDHALSIFLGDNFLNPLSIEIDISISSRATTSWQATPTKQIVVEMLMLAKHLLVIIMIVNNQESRAVLSPL